MTIEPQWPIWVEIGKGSVQKRARVHRSSYRIRWRPVVARAVRADKTPACDSVPDMKRQLARP